MVIETRLFPFLSSFLFNLTASSFHLDHFQRCSNPFTFSLLLRSKGARSPKRLLSPNLGISPVLSLPDIIVHARIASANPHQRHVFHI